MRINTIRKHEEYTLWRRRNRVRLVDVAEFAKCSYSLLSLWENGKANISDEKLQKYDEYIQLFEQRKIYTHN